MTVLPETVSIITAVWGDYWEKYGEIWTKNINNLDPQPTEVIVVSDKPINTKFKVVIEKDLHLSSFRNAGIKEATGYWVVISDIDDIQYPNHICNLDSNFDIIAFSYIKPNGKINKGEIKRWNNLFDINTRNALPSTSAIKRKMLLKVMYRRVGWEDWILWLDLKRAGATIKFDNTIRGLINNTENSLSKHDVEKKDQEVINIKQNEKWI